MINKLNFDFTQIINYINNLDQFLIFTHENPDGDSVGSNLALSHYLTSIGKKVYSISKGPFQKSETIKYKDTFFDDIPIIPNEKTGSILIDCSSPMRTGFGKVITSTFIAIDHHAVVEDDAGTGLIDTSSPSTSLLVCALILHLKGSLSKIEAYNLFRAFCTDTGFFRHLKAESYPYLPFVSAMLEAGISPNEIFDELQGVYTLNSRKFTGYLLNKVESYYNGKLLVITESDQDRKLFGHTLDKDSDTIFKLLLSIENMEVAIILKESERGISVSLRSKNNVDVAQIANNFGGGGHIKAAGCLLVKSLAESKKTLIEAIKPSLL